MKFRQAVLSCVALLASVCSFSQAARELPSPQPCIYTFPNGEVMYDNIALITPEKESELVEDLKKRTGLDIIRVEVGAIDFSKDTAMVKIYYEPLSNEINSIDHVGRLPKMG